MKSHDKFPNPEIYAAKKEIRRRYNAVLSKLIRTIKSAELRDMLSRFRDVLDKPKIDPIGKLPSITCKEQIWVLVKFHIMDGSNKLDI